MALVCFYNFSYFHNIEFQPISFKNSKKLVRESIFKNPVVIRDLDVGPWLKLETTLLCVLQSAKPTTLGRHSDMLVHSQHLAQQGFVCVGFVVFSCVGGLSPHTTQRSVNRRLPLWEKISSAHVCSNN
jgi:hypothetical protein